MPTGEEEDSSVNLESLHRRKMEIASNYSASPVSRLSISRPLPFDTSTERLYASYDGDIRHRKSNKGRKERLYDVLYIKSKTLHDRRGISRASVDHHPLPERVEGGGNTPTLPFTYVQSVHSAMQSFDPSVKRRRRGRLFAPIAGPTRSESPTNSSTTPSAVSSSSTYGPGQPEEAMLGALSALSPDGSAGGTTDWLVHVEGGGGGGVGVGGGKGWTTENTTDRTSLSSSDWGDDVCEFDRQESRRVRIMFEQIEAMLFEMSSVGPAHLFNECRHWVDRFPHLRLLGDQLVTPQDHGFSYYPMPSPNPADDSPRTPTDVSSTPDNDAISLLGRRMEPNSPPTSSRKLAPAEEEESEIEEEVFEMEGVFEDMIAVDHRITEEDVTEKKYMKRRRHHGFPPLTPNAVLKDSIVNAVFDTQWAEIVAWMRPLLTENITRMQGQPKDVDILPVLPLSPTHEENFTSARTDLPPRDLTFARLSRPSPSTPVDEGTLASLLHISIKTLQTRERSSLHDIPESPPVVPHGRRPSSSLPRRPPSSTRLPSARTRGRGRLAPLDRSRTPFHEEESLLRSGLRGRSLQTGGEQLIRSGTLPPLSMSAMASHQPPAARSHGLGRIGSAAGGPGRVSALAQPAVPYPIPDNRPSTTHSFRADTPFGRRSSTPLGIRAGVLLNLDVRGSGIGAGVASGHAQIQHQSLDEGDEHQHARTTNWGSYPPPSHSVNNPYRRAKQLGYIVR